MREFNIGVFDDVISNTSGTWYTPSTLNETLAGADCLVLQGVATMVSGTNPTVTLKLEHSGDGRTWNTATDLVTSNNVSSTPVFVARHGFLSSALLSYVRVKITMGGSSSPQFRLKLYVTGRSD